MTVRGISLDAAGTIIQVKEPVAKTYADIANRHGIAVDAATINNAFRTLFPRMSPLAFGTSDGEQLQRQEREWWRTLVRNCLGRFGQHGAFNAYFDEVYQHYAQADAWILYDDVRPLLSALAARDLPVIVVSNFDSRLVGLLHEFELHSAFRAVLCSSAIGSAKPDARLFNAACDALRSQPSQVLHVGDDRRADYSGAVDAGLQARWLNRSPSGKTEAQEIATLNPVIDLVDG